VNSSAHYLHSVRLRIVADIPRRNIVKSLKKKGFEPTKTGSDHDWYVFCHDGKQYKQVMAKISHGAGHRTYPQALWKRMKTFLQLDNEAQVSDLLKCPMGRDKYVGILKQKNLLSNKPSNKKKPHQRKRAKRKK